MKIAMTYICLWLCTLVCVLFLGCASTPEAPETDDKNNVAKNLVDVVSCPTNTTTNIVVTSSSTNQVTTTTPTQIKTSSNSAVVTPVSTTKEVSPPSPPKDNPRPWDYVLFENSNSALIDGAEVFLYNHPQKQKNTNKLIPHFFDQTKTIDVIFNAHTCPIATNRQLRIFIDPGHGGADPGAVSKDEKTYEKTVTLDIAKRLQTYLSNAGFLTMLSRTDNNTTLTLNERTVMANCWGADAFISIHVNSSKSSSPNGYETYILANVGQLSTSMDKASMTQKDWDFVNAKYQGNNNDKQNLLLGYAIHRRTAKTTRVPDRGLRRARFLVLREVTMPAVLVECAYLSSPKDSKLLYTADYRERCARGIYQGICDYMYGRMQPGLAATPVPTTKAYEAPKPPANHTPDRLAKVMEYAPPTNQPPAWVPNYPEDDPSKTKELALARENALKNAGIIVSPKEDNSASTQPTPAPIQK